MQEILIRAGSFVAIIVLGYILRRVNFFHEGDFKILSKIVLKITLPAAIVSSFANKEVDVGMLAVSLIGLGGGVLYMLIAFGLNFKNSREKKAFDMLNIAGYNIGNFTMPFVQSFLGPVGVITTSLFDTGNAFICLGGAYSVSSLVKGEDSGFPVKQVAKTLAKSIPFDCYIIMAALSIMRIPVPDAVTSFAGIVGNANAFMAMLMIGVGFKLSGNREQLGTVARILFVRYGIAVLMAVGCFFMLPLPLEMRQAIAILSFSPIASAAPAYTEQLKGDVGLASAVNSFSIVISIVCIVIALSLVL